MQDPTEFRKRFLLYKEGKMPYENGLPKYKNGTGGDVPAYQRFVEEMGPVLFGQIVAQGVKNPEKAYRNMITQLAYESNYGTSSVARNLNNYGGVGWNGKTYTTYKDKADFAKNYVRLMNSRYKNVITADTLLDYAKGLKGLGYYEDSLENYARNLTGMKSFAKALDSHIANNPDLYTVVSGKPMSQTTAAELHAASLFEPAPVVIHSDYPINNPSPSSISSWNNPTSPAFNTSGLYARRATNNINNVVQDILFNDKDVLDALMDNLSKNVFGGKHLGFKNGKLPGFRRGKIGHNVSRAQVNDDGTFTDDYAKVFEDMYVTPLKTDLKRNSHTWNSWNYYKSNPTAWMLPFMSSGTNEKGLELVYPEFDLLLGGRQIATLLFPLKSSIKDATEEMINFEDIAKKAAKMKADDDAWRAAHPEYEIENILKKLKLQNAYDPAIEDLVKNANLEDRSLRSVFDKMLYENKDFHGKLIVNLHNNRAKLSGDFVDDAGQVFDVDTPEGYENAILFLEKHFFGTRDGAERLLKDPDFQSRLAGFSMPRGNKPVFISRNKLILRLERDLGRKLTLQEADDLYYKVISHERHHSFDKIHNTPEGFNLDGLSPNDYFVKNGFDELAARGTLLKNMFGLYKNPLTAAHLRYASSQYFKDPSNINNNMTRFFNMITDYDKAAKWLLENATAVLPYTVGGSIVASLPEYKNGKSPIYIKPSKRGSFTAAAKKHGASVAEFERRVLKNPEKYSKAMVKKARFSHNARGWKH